MRRPFQLESGELTATLKVRRRHIIAKYESHLAKLYEENWRSRFPLGRLALPILMTAFSLDLVAENVHLAKPESVGVSSERLKRIDELVARKLDSGELVGAVSLVARKGKIVHFNAAELRRCRGEETDAT